MSERPAASTRRADIDWIRVGAFGLLILYHVGLVYAPWDWHVHSPHTFEVLRYAALITNPWRLTLLFLVSGVALRLMARRMTPQAVAKARLARLAPPFLFGVLVLVPPQSWIEAVEKGSWSQDLPHWWLAEFSWTGLMDGVPLNHLWFVLYIGVYSLLAVALLARPRLLAAWDRRLGQALRGWALLAAPILYLFLVRQGLFARFGLSNHLASDWYNHAMSLGVFLVGFLVAGNAQVWRTLEDLRRPALGIALAALPTLLVFEAMDPGGVLWGGAPKNAAYAIDQWATIAAILGYASRHIRNADTPLLRYLTQAVFPAYLAHQTLLVAAAHLTKRAGLPAWAEAPLLAAATLGGSLLVYEGVRRVNWLRPLWGLKPLPAPVGAGAPGVQVVLTSAPAESGPRRAEAA